MVKPIDVHSLRALLAEGDGDLVLLDCRTPAEIRAASIPGSVHVPMEEIPGRVGELDPRRRYAVLCHHGIRSAMVCRYLSSLGFRHMLNVSGGIDAYAREADPSVGTY